jgi:hypothetical protein
MYVIAAILSLNLNVHVSMVYAFQKAMLLNGLAQTRAEPPFVLTQVLVMILFLALSVVAVSRSRHVPRPRNFG